MPAPAKFLAHTDSGRCHVFEACSFEDAALAFAEAHAPWAEYEPLRVLVQAEDGGPERCFIVHLHEETAEVCI